MSPESAQPAEPLFPYCRELRSKKLAFARTAPRTEDDILDASNHCWCARTRQSLGPDNDLVRPEECRSGRECYRPVL
jgi:hypothetical protein